MQNSSASGTAPFCLSSARTASTFCLGSRPALPEEQPPQTHLPSCSTSSSSSVVGTHTSDVPPASSTSSLASKKQRHVHFQMDAIADQSENPHYVQLLEQTVKKQRRQIETLKNKVNQLRRQLATEQPAIEPTLRPRSLTSSENANGVENQHHLLSPPSFLATPTKNHNGVSFSQANSKKEIEWEKRVSGGTNDILNYQRRTTPLAQSMVQQQRCRPLDENKSELEVLQHSLKQRDVTIELQTQRIKELLQMLHTAQRRPDETETHPLEPRRAYIHELEKAVRAWQQSEEQQKSRVAFLEHQLEQLRRQLKTEQHTADPSLGSPPLTSK